MHEHPSIQLGSSRGGMSRSICHRDLKPENFLLLQDAFVTRLNAAISHLLAACAHCPMQTCWRDFALRREKEMLQYVHGQDGPIDDNLVKICDFGISCRS
eukprot:5141571-Amphidinium_carterae.1